MAKYTQGATAIGEVTFANVFETEKFKGEDTGKFTINVKFSEADTQALLKKIDEEWEAFKNSEEGQAHKYPMPYANGSHEYKDEISFKFAMKKSIKTRSGKMWERTVPIFDASCKEISDSLTSLGRGSKVKVAYSLIPFYVNTRIYGISLRLEGVQVIDLVEAGKTTASSLGFGQEAGFKQADNDEAIADVPFSAEEGDF